ncbi:hypothetical protein L7F22_023850 [Adiantum nelumboides]|nr:hypothetical protein [Adiantum nelumboides]
MGNFTEASKVRKAATYLTGNAGQWWTTLLLQGQALFTWIYFKQIFASAWLSDDFEADVMTEWHQLNAASCKNLDDYNRKFWKALLPVTSYRFVPLTEQIEKYCCGLPKGLRKYCTKTKVTTLTQLIEVANTGNGLLKGEDCEFNTGVKDGSAKKNSAKKYILNEVYRATQEPSKAWKGKATAEPAKGPANKWKKPFPPRKSGEQRQVLKTENKCFICEQPGHYATNCPQKKRQADSEDKEDRKGKRPMAGLVPDMVGDKPNLDASELCRAWGKVRDQTVLIFFDRGAKANFISPELASRLGIRPEEMGYTAEAGLACPGHTEAMTPIIGKLRLHIQSYVDAEEFYIMPLDGCDVLLGIPWLFRVQGILDAYNKKITVQSRGKALILDKTQYLPTITNYTKLWWVPDVLVAHLKEGIEAIHLASGRTVCKLLLQEGGLHADVNGDGVLDHVQAVGGVGAERVVLSGLIEAIRPCTAIATSGIPVREQLFNASICKHYPFGGFHHGFGRGSDSIPLEAVTPVLLPTEDGHRHRRGSHGDLIFLTSRGEVTSYTPGLHGKGAIMRWQVVTGSSWENSFVQAGVAAESVVPTLKVISLRAHGPPQLILVAGETEAVILTASGRQLSSFFLPSPPTHELVVADFSGDGLNDIIVVASNGLYGFVQVQQPGALFFSSLIGCLIVVMCAIFIVQHFSFSSEGRKPGPR